MLKIGVFQTVEPRFCASLKRAFMEKSFSLMNFMIKQVGFDREKAPGNYGCAWFPAHAHCNPIRL
jgi:hypothetical protein